MRVQELDERTILDASEVLTGAPWRDDREQAIRGGSRSRVVWDLSARRVFSYGRHFPLFEFVPRAGREPATFVINGDEWRGGRGRNPSRTPHHQEVCRRAIAATGIRSIIVPFSALDGAGIAPASVRPIHVRDDRRWVEKHALPDGAPDLDALETADRFEEKDERRETDRLGEPCESHGVWWRAYTWNRGGRRYSRTLYRQASGHPWQTSDSWLEPVADHAYLDGAFELKRDADGSWFFTSHEHQLGDSLFSAVRESHESRAADPFEHESETASETVSLAGERGEYCRADDAPDHRHEAGQSAACCYCGQVLRADVTRRRRARYLSSFDTNERQPLYFLAELPRGAGDTVETALEALAPRAVHAALARGRHVLRQGDVFFIATDLTDADLEPRTIGRARLTQWTRDARARRGETGFRPAPTAAERRRELAYARRVWRERFRAAVAGAVAVKTDPDARERSRASWTALLARHALELDAARAMGIDLGTPESSACSHETGCGAGIGEACKVLTDADGAQVYLHAGATAVGCRAIPNGYRRSIVERHAREHEDLERETRREKGPRATGAPFTDAGSRARWRKIRDAYARELDRACEDLRRSVFAGPPAWSGSVAARATVAMRARARLETIVQRGAVDDNGNTSARHARDAYRGRYGTNAHGAWSAALRLARERYRPGETAGTDAALARSERIRSVLAIYGTAHSATEVIRARGGAVYARGIVRHVPGLEPGRRGGRDHAELALGDGSLWYLAVRNTVPRQDSRRTGRRTTAGTMPAESR